MTELRQVLSLKQTLQLVMTPQLQQAIKLLQLSRLELNDLVHKEMLENPVLEDSPEGQEGGEEGAPTAAERAEETKEKIAERIERIEQTGEVKGDQGVADFDWERPCPIICLGNCGCPIWSRRTRPSAPRSS